MASDIHKQSVRRAVILAAGRGTRMGALTADTPKPLLRLAGRPLLEWILEGLQAAGVNHCLIVTGYLAGKIEDYFGQGGSMGLTIDYLRQETPDGTGRALHLARDWAAGEPLFMSYGDIIVPAAHYRAMAEAWRERPCDLMLSLNAVDDPCAGAAVYVEDPSGELPRVRSIIEKPPRGTSTTPWNNAGIFIFSPLIFDYTARLTPSARGEYELTAALDAMIADGRDLRAQAVEGLWSDVGTPEALMALDSQFSRLSQR